MICVLVYENHGTWYIKLVKTYQVIKVSMIMRIDNYMENVKGNSVITVNMFMLIKNYCEDVNTNFSEHVIV